MWRSNHTKMCIFIVYEQYYSIINNVEIEHTSTPTLLFCLVAAFGFNSRFIHTMCHTEIEFHSPCMCADQVYAFSMVVQVHTDRLFEFILSTQKLAEMMLNIFFTSSRYLYVTTNLKYFFWIFLILKGYCIRIMKDRY
jgi:hypothetical protein